LADSQSAQLGSILAQKGGVERINALEEFLQKTPAEFKPIAYFEIAFTAMNMSDYAKAAEAWKTSSELLAPNDPMLPVVGLGQASALNKGGKAAEGVAVLENLLNKVNTTQNVSSFIKMELAALAELAGQWEKSVALYEELALAEEGEGKNFFSFRATEIRAKNSDASELSDESGASASPENSIDATAENEADGN
jgi:predicted Zn-dependent protease